MSQTSSGTIKQAFVKALRSQGSVIRPNAIGVSEKAGNLRFAVRLDAHRKALPSPAVAIAGIDQGKVPPQSIPGAKYLLIGMVQSSGALNRVTARVVEVETAVILQTAKADVPGNSSGIDKGISQIVRQLISTPQDS